MLSTDLGQTPAEAAHNATLIADKIRAALSEPCVIDGVRHACSASVGVQLLSGNERDAETVLQQTDAAMYADKKAARQDSVARVARPATARAAATARTRTCAAP